MPQAKILYPAPFVNMCEDVSYLRRVNKYLNKLLDPRRGKQNSMSFHELCIIITYVNNGRLFPILAHLLNATFCRRGIRDWG